MRSAEGGRGPRTWLTAGGVTVCVAAMLLVVAGLGVAQERKAAPKPEYARVTEMPGLLGRERVGEQTRTVFLAEDGSWKALLLENQILAALEEQAGVPTGRRVVKVTGMVSEYRGRNYLLLTAVELGAARPGG